MTARATAPSKVLCHDLWVLLQSMYELGIEPEFWTLEETRL
jgi:hypothetical protein